MSVNGSITRVSAFLYAWRNIHGDSWPTVPIAEADGVPLLPLDLRAVADLACDDDLLGLEVPTRVYNALRQGGIRTVEQLAGHTAEELLDLRGIGVGGVRAIRTALRRHGLTLAGDGE